MGIDAADMDGDLDLDICISQILDQIIYSNKMVI